MTKILVDSSAWIHFFNHSSPLHHQHISETLIKDQVTTCGLIITEVLRGARTEKERKILTQHFNVLDFLNLLREDFFEATQIGFDLQRKGFVIKTIDLLIAHLAIKNRVAVLHDDRDFEIIARHTSLKTIYPKVPGSHPER